jgi:hypothetical protein
MEQAPQNQGLDTPLQHQNPAIQPPPNQSPPTPQAPKSFFKTHFFVFVITGILFFALSIGLAFVFFNESKAKHDETAETSPKSTPNPLPKDQIDFCNSLNGSSFESLEKLELGLGPSGAVLGYWKISFRNGKFQWSHSDVSENGTYTCSDSMITAKFSDRTTTANYDPTTGILTWEEVEYKANINPTSIPDKTSTLGPGCKIGGCSGEICQNETDEDTVSTCIYKEEFACYKTARCEKQSAGNCGWTLTDELKTCINNARELNSSGNDSLPPQ